MKQVGTPGLAKLAFVMTVIWEVRWRIRALQVARSSRE
jgi:hypothetical protein